MTLALLSIIIVTRSVLGNIPLISFTYSLNKRRGCSGERTRLPPVCPGFDSWTRSHMWVEFVVGSLLCSERFFSGYSGFLLSSKTNISKFQFDLDYCQALYYEALVRVIAQALPVFDVKFTLFLHFSRKLVRGFFLSASKTTIMVLLKSGVTGKFLRNYWQVTIF